MREMYRELDPPARILLGPGPSNVHPRVRNAMATPLVGHLDPHFLEIMNEVKSLLQYVFQTNNFMTIAISGTGSAGMETCLCNLIEPGDRVAVCVNGVFGERMTDVAARCGAEVIRVEADWGKIVEVDQVSDVLSKGNVKLVALVHAETSTGVRQPIEGISQLVHDAGALLLLDTVTSLGGCKVALDEWHVDACYSGTQKCLSCPPGLAPVSFSDDAMEVIHARKTKVQSWYLDISMLERYWGEERFYHHTAPISMLYALREALKIIQEEGLEKRFQRHETHHRALAAGLKALGLDLFAQEGYRLPMLNSVTIPKGADDAAARRALLDQYGIEIGGGLGAYKGKLWRIGLMGESCTRRNVVLLLSALEDILRSQECEVKAGAGVSAAFQVYST